MKTVRLVPVEVDSRVVVVPHPEAHRPLVEGSHIGDVGVEDGGARPTWSEGCFLTDG